MARRGRKIQNFWGGGWCCRRASSRHSSGALRASAGGAWRGHVRGLEPEVLNGGPAHSIDGLSAVKPEARVVQAAFARRAWHRSSGELRVLALGRLSVKQPRWRRMKRRQISRTTRCESGLTGSGIRLPACLRAVLSKVRTGSPVELRF